MLTIDLDLAEVQREFRLTERELDRAFARAASIAARRAYRDVPRMMQEATGVPAASWRFAERIFSQPDRLQGNVRLWIGYNDYRTRWVKAGRGADESSQQTPTPRFQSFRADDRASIDARAQELVEQVFTTIIRSEAAKIVRS